MLTKKSKQLLIDAVEEEIQDLDKYPFLCSTKVGVLYVGEYQVQILVTRDDEDFIAIHNNDEEE